MVLNGGSWQALVPEGEGGLPLFYTRAAHVVVVRTLGDLCGLGMEEAVVEDERGGTWDRKWVMLLIQWVRLGSGCWKRIKLVKYNLNI